MTAFHCHACDEGLVLVADDTPTRRAFLRCRRCKLVSVVDIRRGPSGAALRCPHPHPTDAGEVCNAVLAHRHEAAGLLLRCRGCREPRVFVPREESTEDLDSLRRAS